MDKRYFQKSIEIGMLKKEMIHVKGYESAAIHEVGRCLNRALKQPLKIKRFVKCLERALRVTEKSMLLLKKGGLAHVSMKDANMKGASMKGASMKGANMKGANMKGENMKDANMKGGSIDTQHRQAEVVLLLLSGHAPLKMTKKE
jgi:hypothetical protein